jgi:hypothetical protein
MSILTRLRLAPRRRAAPPAGPESADASSETERETETEARAPVWPLVVLMAGALLSGLWVLALLFAAYRGLLWAIGTG